MNPTQPPFVAIDLDRPRRMLLDLNAVIRLEELTGCNMLAPQAWKEFLENLRGGRLRALLYVALLRDDPELTEQSVGAMIHTGNMGEVMEKLMQAIAVSQPEAEKSSRPLAESGPSTP